MLVSDVREIARRLRPPQLDDLGLLAALRSHVDSLRQVSGLQIALTAACEHRRLPADLELACFRIVQEAINNAIRHAEATKIRVTVVCSDDELSLAIRDNGKGFSLSDLKTSRPNYVPLGLLGMRERAANLGGELNIVSDVGDGTEVVARFPLKALHESR